MTACLAGGTPGTGGLALLMTREHWFEVARIVVTDLSALFFGQGIIPIEIDPGAHEWCRRES